VVSLLAVSPLYGQSSSEDIGRHVQEIDVLVREALEASRAAEEASSVAQVKARADEVYAAVWGISSGLADEAAQGAARVHGWKVRWQVTFADFDSTFEARYGRKPPEIIDPAELGIVGRGRDLRDLLLSVVERESTPMTEREAAESMLASLNNVIGWMKMDDGVTKGELQPRVDLTREWDSPPEFWLSTSDTGWLHEASSQALNILKTNYAGDVKMARDHAAGMTELMERYIEGVDADDDGTIDAVKMEGGLQAVLDRARSAGYLE
jgi:hypothetical protein